MTPPDATAKAERQRDMFICLVLVVGILAIYGQVADFQFVNYDDPDFVSGNPIVKRGLSLDALVYAFTRTIASNWHPLTTLSHTLDVQLFGLAAGRHHLVNMGFHVANTLLLFLVFRQMTHRAWRSGVVAALFAWHPLHVESVAWVAERKDLLSALFWMLTLWAYVRYVAQSGVRRYLLVLLFYCLALLSKPMVVTLPFVLLLLDYWPLGRLRLPGLLSLSSAREMAGLRGRPIDSVAPTQATPPPASRQVFRLVLEKVPLLLLAAAMSMVTYFVQEQTGAMKLVLPFSVRLANAVVSYARYLGKMFVPVDLAVLYPHPGHWAAGVVIGALVVLGIVSAGTLLLARRQPWLLVGWLWFLGTLVPVIGLVQAGFQAMADRYSYLPLIGLFLALTWSGASLVSRWPAWGRLMPTTTVLLLGVCLGLSWRQTRYWQNSITLFSHALACTTNNPIAHNNLGNALREAGQREVAAAQFQEALRLKPDYPQAYNSLGAVLYDQGRGEEAIQNMQKALELDPNLFVAHENLGNIFWKRGQAREAILHWREALRLRPDDLVTLQNLAWLLATHPQSEYRNGSESIRLAQHGCALTGDRDVNLLGTLAAAYAEAGQFPEAVAAAEKAIAAATTAGLTDQAAAHRRLEQQFYQQGKPFRDPRHRVQQ